jgi:predicted metal-binding protein
MLVDMGLDFPVYRVEELVHARKVQDWCRLPYPGHPKGCPNYNKVKKCPPQCPYVTDIFDIKKPMYLIHSEFDLQAHVERLRLVHPNWYERQLRCVLYWQPKSRNQLYGRVRKFWRHNWGHNLKEQQFEVVHFMPESLGVNVYVTAAKAGLKLEPIKKLKICRHVALMGSGR